jgi:hypothetical protein
VKRFPHLLHPILISLVLILITNSIGYAKESINPNLASNCGEWRDEGSDFIGPRGIGVTLAQKATGNDCNALFTLRNQIDHYSLFLNSTPHDANIQFLPYGEPILVPGLDIDVKTTPNNVDKVATIGLEGVINGKSATVDASLWLLRSVLELIPLPTGCSLPPPDQLLLLSFRLAPILESSVQLGIKGDFIGARREFSRAINAYFEKAGDLGKGLAYDCVLDAAKLFIKKPVIAFKIATGYLSWLGATLFDLYKYQGPAANTTVILSYIPTPTVGPPPAGGNLRQIGFLKDGNVWLINDDGSNQAQITNSGQVNYFRWSPDGERIFYSRIDIIDKLYVYDLASRQESSITIPRPSVDNTPNFDVSPDGKTLLLLMATEDTGLTYSLLSLDLGTGNIRQITSLDGAFVRVRFLNASDEVVLAECAQACGISTLNLENLQSEEFTDLVFGWAFDVLPGKRAIAVEHSLGFLGLVPCGNDPACQVPSGIYEFDLDIRKYSPLVLDEEQVVTEPDISADNNYLVFQRGGNIEIKNLSTGEITSLTSGSLPSWRPSPELSTPIPQPTPDLSIPLQPTPTSEDQYAKISREVGEVNLRRTPGYANKNDLDDVIVKIPSGATVKLLKGSQKADGLNWWYVEWNGYEGWIAERTRTGRTVMIFSP